MKTATQRLLWVLAALALGVTACGSGDEATTASPRGEAMADGSANSESANSEMADGEMSDDHGDHGDHGGHGEPIEIPDGMAVPQIAIEAVADPMSGHNLYVELTDFTVAPERASTDPVDGEGHLHLYLNGERQMRFYNTALHLSDLPEGEHTVMVEVSANNHAAYVVDGEPIAAMTSIVVEASSGHSHETDPVDVDGFAAPEIETTVVKDPKSGWNLSIELENFTITPENASSAPVDGEGYLHLIIDGERQGRLYGTDWHIPALSEGRHEIAVEVSHNDHAPYGIDGEPIRGVAMIEVAAEDATDTHDHSADSHDHGDHDHEGGEEMSMADGDEADVRIAASITGGDVTVSENRFEVPLGSVVAIDVDSDTADELHVHGYDFFADVTPGTTTSFAFEADLPGVFEVELESAGTFLFEIQVS